MLEADAPCRTPIATYARIRRGYFTGTDPAIASDILHSAWPRRMERHCRTGDWASRYALLEFRPRLGLETVWYNALRRRAQEQAGTRAHSQRYIAKIAILARHTLAYDLRFSF